MHNKNDCDFFYIVFFTSHAASIGLTSIKSVQRLINHSIIYCCQQLVHLAFFAQLFILHGPRLLHLISGAIQAAVCMREMAWMGVPWSRVVPGEHTYYKGGKPFQATEKSENEGLIHSRAFGGTAKWRTCYTSDGTGHAVTTFWLLGLQ